jgi:hypothetical protein
MKGGVSAGTPAASAADELRVRRARTRRGPQVQTNAGASRRPGRTCVVRPQQARRRPTLGRSHSGESARLAPCVARVAGRWLSRCRVPRDKQSRDDRWPLFVRTVCPAGTAVEAAVAAA